MRLERTNRARHTADAWHPKLDLATVTVVTEVIDG